MPQNHNLAVFAKDTNNIKVGTIQSQMHSLPILYIRPLISFRCVAALFSPCSSSELGDILQSQPRGLSRTVPASVVQEV
jgi:hypothetical protein